MCRFNNKFKGLYALIAVLGALPGLVYAAEIPDSRRASFGVLGGYSDPDGPTFDGTGSYGVEIGFQPHEHIGLAIEGSGFASDSGSTDGSPTLTRTKALAKGTLDTGLGGVYAGGAAGQVWDHVSFEGTDSEFAYGPVLGFDVPIGVNETNFTVGAAANYLFVGGDHLDSYGIDAALKYWF